MYRFFLVSGMALLALCLSGFPDGRVIDRKGKDFCEILNSEILVAGWGNTVSRSKVSSRYDLPSDSFECSGPILVMSPVMVDLEGAELVVDGPWPGIILGTWDTRFHIRAAGVRNVNIMFTKRASDGFECWNNDCAGITFGTPQAIRNNGISVHHCPHCTVENVTVRGGPSGGIIVADSHYALVRDAEVSGARFDGVGCNATYLVRFEDVYAHHNAYAGLTVDINGSCEFVNVVSAYNGHHGLYARDTYDPIRVVGSRFLDNGDTGIFLDRSVPGNPKSCVADLAIRGTEISGGNMAVWIDPDCQNLPGALRIADSAFSAETPACAQEAARREYADLDRACPVMPSTPMAEIPHDPPS